MSQVDNHRRHSSITRMQVLIEPVLSELGLELVGIDYRPSENALLRVYIDKDGGVSIDDCAAASLQISAIFDVEDPIAQSYKLEVSSPGLDRPLFKVADYVRFANHLVKIKLAVAFEGRRNFAGLLRGVEDDMAIVVVDDQEFLLPIEQIERANIVPSFAKGAKK